MWPLFNEKDFGYTDVEEKTRTIEVDFPMVQEETDEGAPAPTEHRCRLRARKVRPIRYGYDEYASSSP